MEPKRVYNFNPGPAALPLEVMKKAQEEFLDYRGIGYGIVEASHRSKAFEEVNDAAEANLRKLLNISSDYAVLFLQGGGSLQFAMVPMNLAVPGKKACYADTGEWTFKAIKEAKLLTDVDVTYDGRHCEYKRIGDCTEWDIPQDAAYFYVCSNNTVHGTQYHFFPETGDVPLVADMSSDFCSRRVDVSKFGLIFAGAQKNVGPAGLTIVIVRKDLLKRTPANVPTMLKYSTFAESKSLYNTPPVFGIYMFRLVTDWLLASGGLEAIEKINNVKSQNLYERLDLSIFYKGTVEPADRSKMNVCYRLPEEALEEKFVKEAKAAGLDGLKGHRAVGGIRASLYNAVPLAAVSSLIDFMTDFEEKNG